MITNLPKTNQIKRMWKTNWKDIQFVLKNTANQSSTWLSNISAHIPSSLATVIPLPLVYTNGPFKGFMDIAWWMTFMRCGHTYGRTDIIKEMGAVSTGWLWRDTCIEDYHDYGKPVSNKSHPSQMNHSRKCIQLVLHQEWLPTLLS